MKNLFLAYLLLSFAISQSQNLIKNPSFEEKTNIEFTYAHAHRTLANWENIRTYKIALYHPIAALYIDTTLFAKFDDDSFPLTPQFREVISQPIDGNCYIKSNSFHRNLFTQSLEKTLQKDEVYIVRFAYQAKSFSNESDKINSAHFGVSFTRNKIEKEYFMNPKFEKDISIRFKELNSISNYNPLSKSIWIIASFSFIAKDAYSYINIGSHTDLAINEEHKKALLKAQQYGYGGTDGIDISKSESFVWLVDDLKLYKLTDFLHGDFKHLKNNGFDVPITNENKLSTNKYLQELIFILKMNNDQYKSIQIHLTENSRISSSDILEYLQQNGISKLIEINKTLTEQQLKSAQKREYLNLRILIL